MASPPSQENRKRVIDSLHSDRSFGNACAPEAYSAEKLFESYCSKLGVTVEQVVVFCVRFEEEYGAAVITKIYLV